MGEPGPHAPAVLIVAAFSRYASALDWARREATGLWGPIAMESEPIEFVETDYYESTMGSGLVTRFWAFEELIDPARLPEIKHQTNAWEAAYAKLGAHGEPRPLNLDPGYLTPAKLVLASTKDHAHRIYLRDGIYAEVTLLYQARRWQPRDWTYPNYRRPDVQQFLTAGRAFLQTRLRSGPVE